MDSELRIRKPAIPKEDEELTSSEDQNQESTPRPANGTRTQVLSDELTEFPKGHKLTATQKENLVKESAETAYGKTPNGTIFRVPVTRDMVSELFDISKRKSLFDVLTLTVMGIQVLLFITLPSAIRRWFFLLLFVIFRSGYNAGLGYLLKLQSDHRGLVVWAREKGIFDKRRDNPWYSWLKQELSCKMGPDYRFDSVPIEYNTWLLFRQLVDLILMNDFTSYVCFGLSWLTFPVGSGFISHLLRWVGGLVLLLFNIWVKLDAHRVVKDFAWYWGDFFFLIEQSLTFDGVFEMAPHPMYSVGYAGYYGLSLITASYMVLFVSLFAHAAQFVFLTLVENPHIDKTYSPPLVHKKRTVVLSEQALNNPSPDADVAAAKPTTAITTSPNTLFILGTSQASSLVPCGSKDMYSTYFRRDLIVFKNFDPFRATDIFVSLIILYATIVPLLFSNMGPGVITFFIVFQALLWRIFHSYVLGFVLYRQSTDKFYTKHFIKHGGTVQDAFQSWKSIFNLSNSMTYATFFLAAFKMYSLPEDWTYGTVLLRHVLGLALIALHIWTSVSVFEVLGDFGWFYGDFFLEESSNGLFYTGIYRFVNNPEKVMGHAAFWGMTLICSSWPIFILAMFSQISNFLFLHFVESPHMRRIYGDKVRKDAGVVKTVKAAAVLSKKVKDDLHKIREKLGETLGEAEVLQKTREVSEKAHEFFVEGTIPKIQEMVSNSKAILENSREKLFVARTWDDMGVYDVSQYSIKIICEKDAAEPTTTNDSAMPVFELGEKVLVEWTAPLNHGSKDWIGIYKVLSNTSYKSTNVASKGRYLFISRNAVTRGAPSSEQSHLDEDVLGADGHTGKGDGEVIEEEIIWVNNQEICRGRVVFLGDKLPWFPGTFEFRYHHHGRYNVMAYTAPFEITLEADESKDLSVDSVSQRLLPYVQRCFSLDEDTMPCAVDERFVMINQTIAQRIVKGIHMMYGIEFAWEVVAIDMSCLHLAMRIMTARRALAPFTVASSPSLTNEMKASSLPLAPSLLPSSSPAST
ncbi:phospholipid methyltransferase-domain-containing protein [Lobosporangium transversale]|uniref:Phosphatidylethanolamine N-methyltransferase n=1 Tax=Lobosporangium transversale TaxID=64571 RepID=A0A1Y2G8X5_9FUNG|nr:phospholipid methyltransferase-domain-containing protein [Lobosporangium transversale]ORZ04453.1 phospholipid methyltransferase-domain-containing protein [Lobosporangium transversale]|eukprot:XP_021876561.1 phospholipid methyltransferase-domain-containing protein [Lobosporangium transversale]